MVKEIKIANVKIGGDNIFCLIAGPCVIENERMVFYTAENLKKICEKEKVPFIFKASFDKANRSSIRSFRGPGIKKGLEILAKVKEKFEIPITTDVHCYTQIIPVADVVDIIQIPAFLCRQTDLLVAAGKTGKVVNVKKGQFLSPWEVKNIIEKVVSTGNKKVVITERGTSFGYNNLVSDFRSIPIMRSFGYPVIFDATHSVQQPGGLGKCSGGNREFVPYLAKAAMAVGCDGIFAEVHPDPARALSDSSNMLNINEMKKLLAELKDIYLAVSRRSKKHK
ncbi:MAG TPA: 3-deoxy-8-phosphooctulonate synthase [bacterium]|nr:3-deoxy-8-phosphooctulonate synthase [bacterium]HPP30043.1 3-deoxy-8-phosphooctulonate synthase [bacterium]